MSFRLSLSLSLAAALSFGASLMVPAAWAAPSQAAAVMQIGRDAAGRPCQARRVFGDPLASGRGDRAYDLSCGRSSGLGRLYVFSENSLARIEAWRTETARTCLASRSQSWSAPGLETLESLYCGGDRPALGQATPGRAASLALAARRGGSAFAGDAALAAGPALERAIRILAGLEPEPRADAPAGPRSALLDSLEAALGQELTAGGYADFVTLKEISILTANIDGKTYDVMDRGWSEGMNIREGGYVENLQKAQENVTKEVSIANSSDNLMNLIYNKNTQSQALARGLDLITKGMGYATYTKDGITYTGFEAFLYNPAMGEVQLNGKTIDSTQKPNILRFIINWKTMKSL
ncbi:MAG: hypothetical protein EBZ48_17290, partial [Proteobacteria bacterium]|nr:hypothetical protein [Pseudomonadota bacterium]